MEIWTNWQIGRRGEREGMCADRSNGAGQVGWELNGVVGKEREKNQPRAVCVLRGADSKGIYCYEIRLFLIVENFKHLDC